MKSKAFMSKFVRMLNKFEDMSLRACGHDLEVYKANMKRDELISYVRGTIKDMEDTIDRLSREAAKP